MGTVTVQRQILDFENRKVQIENNAKLTRPQKSALLARLTELSNQRGTMLQGAVFMLNHSSLKFDDFENALVALDRSGKNANNLGAVEVAIQSQIDSIRRINDKRITPENKSLCLHALQNMIIALSDYPLGKGQVNDFVPVLLKEEAQLYIKGTARGLDLDSMKHNIYTNQYSDPKNPVLAKWKFLDREKIKEIDDAMMYSKTTGKEIVKENSQLRFPEELYADVDEKTGMAHIGAMNVVKTPREKINRIVVEAMRQFNIDDLKDHIPQFFNFVKGEYKAMNKGVEAKEVNAEVLHNVVFSVMRKLVEIGNDQQRREMFEKSVAQNNEEGRNL